MKNKETIRLIVGNALLIAFTVVLTYISNNISIAGVSINLGLIPISIAAILYGKWSGVLIGCVNGGMAMLSAASFFAISPIGTIIVCLLKTGIAGFLATIIYRLLKNKSEHLGVIAATIIVPIINTLIFIIGSLIFFNGALGELISAFIGINFLVEIIVSSLLCSSIYYIVRIFNKKYVK